MSSRWLRMSSSSVFKSASRVQPGLRGQLRPWHCTVVAPLLRNGREDPMQLNGRNVPLALLVTGACDPAAFDGLTGRLSY
jgi:hypothetical protein